VATLRHFLSRVSNASTSFKTTLHAGVRLRSEHHDTAAHLVLASPPTTYTSLPTSVAL